MAMQEAALEQRVDVVFGWDDLPPRDQHDARKPAQSGASASLRRSAAEANGSRLKRAVDIAGALIGLVLLAPLFVVVALLIKAESPGPMFFRQERYGQGRRRFFILKFRSMRVTESVGPFRQASSDDSRITSVGRVIRRTSIDEIPQLLNVLRGEMSLVGPRPHAVAMDDVYARSFPNYFDRLLVKPGLTGLAQISGFRGPTGERRQIRGRIRRDRAYIKDWRLARDIRILLATPIRLMDRGVY